MWGAKRSYENLVYGFKIEPISTELIVHIFSVKLIMRVYVSRVEMSIDQSPNDNL